MKGQIITLVMRNFTIDIICCQWFSEHTLGKGGDDFVKLMRRVGGGRLLLPHGRNIISRVKSVSVFQLCRSIKDIERC